ncbi:MAG: MlaD family protein [Candidatus Entotheonellia bacterium]
MGRRANPKLIGAFLVGAVALIIIGILVFARGQFLSDTLTFVMFFEGSVKGLDVGAPVNFQGVRVGSVTDIRVEHVAKDDHFRIPVFIQLEADRVTQVGERMTRAERIKTFPALIARGLRAQLGTVSLVTGQLYVQLDFYPGTPVKLVGADLGVPELPTIPTPLQEVSATAQELIEKLKQLPLDQLFANILATTQGLKQLVNAPEIPDLLRAAAGAATTTQQLVQRVDDKIVRVLDNVDGASYGARAVMTDVQQLVRNVNARVGPLTDGIKDTLEVARAMMKDGQQLVRHGDGQIARLSNNVGDTTKAAQHTLQVDLQNVLQEAMATMRAIRLLADYLERNPNALVYGKGGDRR